MLLTTTIIDDRVDVKYCYFNIELVFLITMLHFQETIVRQDLFWKVRKMKVIPEG